MDILNTIKDYGGWALLAVGTIYTIMKSKKESNKLVVDTDKSSAETKQIEINNRKSLTDQLDMALDKNLILRKQVEDLLTELDKQKFEIIELKRKLNVYKTFDPLIK